MLKRRPRHQSLGTFVNVAKPLLEPHDRFAVRREAEMAGLDNARMDRANRDFMQALAFGRQECVAGIVSLAREPAFFGERHA